MPARALKYPLRNPLPQNPLAVVAGDAPAEFSWPTGDNQARVDITLNLSLDEYVMLASAIDVGRDIAYGEYSDYVWAVWNRALSIPIPVPTRAVQQWIPDGVTFDVRNGTAQIDIKEDCTMPIIINVYEGCCYPSGSDGQTGSGGITSSSNSGGLIGGGVTPYGAASTSPCDAAYTTVPYIVNQARRFIQDFDTLIQNALIAPDAIATAASGIPIVGGIPESYVNQFDDILSNCVDDALSALIDADLIYKLQLAWIETFGNASQMVSVTRDDLRSWANRAPLIWGSVIDGCVFSPRVFFGLWTNVMDVNAVSQRLKLAAGTGTGVFCEAIYQDAGAIAPTTSGRLLPSGAPSVTTQIVQGDGWGGIKLFKMSFATPIIVGGTATDEAGLVMYSNEFEFEDATMGRMWLGAAFIMTGMDPAGGNNGVTLEMQKADGTWQNVGAFDMDGVIGIDPQGVSASRNTFGAIIPGALTQESEWAGLVDPLHGGDVGDHDSAGRKYRFRAEVQYPYTQSVEVTDLYMLEDAT